MEIVSMFCKFLRHVLAFLFQVFRKEGQTVAIGRVIKIQRGFHAWIGLWVTLYFLDYISTKELTGCGQSARAGSPRRQSYNGGNKHACIKQSNRMGRCCILNRKNSAACNSFIIWQFS